MLIGAAVILAKLPLLFTTIGEQDHGRLMMDAIVYANDGPETLRWYGILTSPLWTLSFAGIGSVLGWPRLVLISNVAGWLCGGLATALAFVLLRMLGATRAWAGAGAVACGMVPGTFYLSLYGYPSQCALFLLLGSAVAFARGLETKRAVWLALTAVAYCAFVLTKIDFALGGTFLVSVAIVARHLFHWRTWLLPVFALSTLCVLYVVTRTTIRGEDLVHFVNHTDDVYPWMKHELTGSDAVTVLYACGFGTLALWACAVVAGLIRGKELAHVGRITIAWAVGALPLWVFWLGRPPMSARHAACGVVVTVLFAALMGSHLLSRRPLAALVWLVAVVAINWPFGGPGMDFNYRPSGNFGRMLSVHHRAFAVGDDIARTVSAKHEPIKVVVGSPRDEVLDRLDFTPAIEVEMARRSKSVHAEDFNKQLIFMSGDGYQTRLFVYQAPVIFMEQERFRGASFYLPFEVPGMRPLDVPGLNILTFDANVMFQSTERR